VGCCYPSAVLFAAEGVDAWAGARVGALAWPRFIILLRVFLEAGGVGWGRWQGAVCCGHDNIPLHISAGAPPVVVDVVRSFQARNGRLKRLSESLSQGFDVNAQDEFGNTLLLVGAQNVG
jgi:hypothetical protein